MHCPSCGARLNLITPSGVRVSDDDPGRAYCEACQGEVRKWIEHPDPSIAANVIIGLIKVTNYLLDQQIRRLEQDFLKEGGLRERMTQARLTARARQQRDNKRD